MQRDVSSHFSLITLKFERPNRSFKWKTVSCPSLFYRMSFWQNNCTVTEEGEKFCRCRFVGSIQLLRAFFVSCVYWYAKVKDVRRDLFSTSLFFFLFDWNIPLRKALPLLPVALGMLLCLIWLAGNTVHNIYLEFRRKKIFMSREFPAVFLEHLKT